MLMSCKCPQCGRTKDFVAEEVGQTAHCMECGTAFQVTEDTKQVSGHLGKAAAAVFGTILLFGGAVWMRMEFQRDVKRLGDRIQDAAVQRLEYEMKQAEKAASEVRKQIREIDLDQ